MIQVSIPRDGLVLISMDRDTAVSLMIAIGDTWRETGDFDALYDAMAAALKDPVVKPCKDCGCSIDVHHKLRCENEHCPGGCNGWTCPDHGWVLCGCTYAGGVDPETGRHTTPDTQPSKDTQP